MKHSQLAAQLYTVRDYAKTTADFAGTMKKIKAIGYEAVQVSGIGPVPEDEIRRISEGEGLTICATHENGATIIDNVDSVIARLKAINCKYTAYPWPHIVPATHYGAVDMAKKLNASAEKMAAAGLGLCYHNHAIEFQRLDGELLLDIYYNNAPALLGEIDTFWVQAGGGNPVEWVKKLAGRMPLLHLKEFAVSGNDKRMSYIGGGNLDWKNIIAAGEAGGVEYYIVEQDDCNGMCPFEALKRSYDYLTENFVR